MPRSRPRSTQFAVRACRALWPRLDNLEPRTLLDAASNYGRLPTPFEVNAGQTDAQVSFLAHGPGYALFLTPGAAVLSLRQGAAPASASGPAAASLPGPAAAPPAPAVVRMQLVGSNPSAQVVGQDELPGKTNYFIGNDPSQWHVGIANFGRVAYQGVYPGIDLAYHGEQGQLEYDFDVAPGANPAAIALKFPGASSATLNAAGDLILHASGGDVVQHAPVAYQTIGGRQVAVQARFVVRSDGTVTFAVGRYNHAKALVIDPVLVYSTYLGGSNTDFGGEVAVDAAGHAYLYGSTVSTNFPTKNPLQPKKVASSTSTCTWPS
jgi:hypothetical protein